MIGETSKINNANENLPPNCLQLTNNSTSITDFVDVNQDDSEMAETPQTEQPNLSFAPGLVQPPGPYSRFTLERFNTNYAHLQPHALANQILSTVSLTQSCSQLLSFHSLLCNCKTTCCCFCSTICPSDCQQCIECASSKYLINYVGPPVRKKLIDWTHQNVIDFCKSLHLHKYVNVIETHKITGADLFIMNNESLQNFGIKNRFHQAIILKIVEKLKNKDINKIKEESEKFNNFESMRHNADLSTLERCISCNKFTPQIQVPNSICQIFGVPLCVQFDVRDSDAPFLVVRCLRELETYAISCTNVDLFKLYEVNLSHCYEEKLKELRNLIDRDVSNVDWSVYAPEIIVLLLKEYLKELPDPLIPVRWYDCFMEASRIKVDEDCGLCLFQIVQKLPSHHKSTIKYILSHICRICKLQFNRGCRKTPSGLIRGFSTLFLHPTWENIIEIVYNNNGHVRILDMLLRFGDWGERMPEFHEIPPSIPPRKSSTSIYSQESPVYYISDSTCLNDAEWYWGDISREEVEKKFTNTPDGTFLVRNSTNKTEETSWTLVLKKDGRNRLIKILHKNNKYGFTEPNSNPLSISFSSVVELINYYRNKSLSVYNASLDIKLMYPISRFQQDGIQEDIEMPNDTISKALVDLNSLFSINKREHAACIEEFSSTSKDIQLKRQALDSINKILIIFEEQIKLQENFQKEAQPCEVNSFTKNTIILRDRLNSLKKSKEELENNIQKQVRELKSIEIKMQTLNQQNQSIHLQKEKYIKLLKSKGSSEECITALLSGGSMSPDLTYCPHQDEGTWLLNLSRNKAEELLDGRPEGTFLIRPSRTGQYALSIVCNRQINHCIIFYNTGRGYGFAEPYIIYDSLKALVLHYSQNSLEEHNDLLTVTLAYPVFMDRAQISHDKTVGNTVNTICNHA